MNDLIFGNRLLVIDDELAICRPIKHVAEGCGFAVVITDDSETFVRRLRCWKPTVIVLDLKMPKVDGIEVLRQIKTNETTRTIPVVIMTSSKEEQDIIASYDLGVNSYVVKPVDFEGFAKAVSELGMYWLLINQSVD